MAQAQIPVPATQSIAETFRRLKASEPRVKRTGAAERIAKLRSLKRALFSRREELQQAMARDFGKPATEADITEIYTTVMEIDFAAGRLKRWIRPQPVSNPLVMTGFRCELMYEPKGTVLIIGPWNYPVCLVLKPLVAAVAAGNCVMIKPSELVPATSRFLKSLIEEVFSRDEVAVCEGGPDVAQELLKQPFDHVLFTGSTRVGRIVMEAAARNLTPVTLELGGKSPTIVDESADLRQAAERVAWGKCLNSGQTCIAPDYALVHERVREPFLRELKAAIQKRFDRAEDRPAVITAAHYDRLKRLLSEAVARGARVEVGGRFDDASRRIEPTVLTEVPRDATLMQEEIFGPILPVLTFSRLEEIYERLQGAEKPLALYIYSRDERRVREILANTTSGGACVNTNMLHFGNPHLPFGGVGHSGTGSYQGHFGFRTFSHERAVLRQGPLDAVRLFFPPYTQSVAKLVKWAIRWVR